MWSLTTRQPRAESNAELVIPSIICFLVGQRPEITAASNIRLTSSFSLIDHILCCLLPENEIPQPHTNTTTTTTNNNYNNNNTNNNNKYDK